MRITRGFQGRQRRARDPHLPPGQYDAKDDWPVLNIEPTPMLATSSWTFTIKGAVEERVTWSWEEIHSLPTSSYQGDIHCVTTWSKLGTTFTGVSVDALLARARPLASASHVLISCHTDYTTNLPLADVTNGQAWVVWDFEGQPLEAIHGGPARLLVPHLYFWKSAKWVASITVLDHDEAGFWESNGYHHRGDPWPEQRYHGD